VCYVHSSIELVSEFRKIFIYYNRLLPLKSNWITSPVPYLLRRKAKLAMKIKKKVYERTHFTVYEEHAKKDMFQCMDKYISSIEIRSKNKSHVILGWVCLWQFMSDLLLFHLFHWYRLSINITIFIIILSDWHPIVVLKRVLCQKWNWYLLHT
jgi:hypothetical protein